MLGPYIEHIQNTVEQFSAASFVVEASLDIDVRPGGQAYIVGKLYFIDGSVLHFREYLDSTARGVEKITYTYHYQEATGALLFRYDNANHRPPLGFRAHKHLPNGIIPADPPTLEDVLLEIVQTRRFES